MDTGNDGSNFGVGMNINNWLAYNVFLSSDIGFGANYQLTPYFTGGVSQSFERGISVSGGVIIGDTTHEMTVSVGNGTLIGYAACAGIATLALPGAKTIAAFAAGAIFIYDMFN